MYAGVGEQGAAQALLDRIVALARQRQQIAAPGQATRGGTKMGAHAVQRAARGDTETQREFDGLLDQLGILRHGPFGGLGRRRGAGSAARSISVQSVSWPTAEMSGMVLSAAARTTALLVEAPQVLQAAAAARDDQHVGPRNAPPRQRIEASDGSGHLGRAGLPLHPDRPQQHARRKALVEPPQHVADHRAGRRGHDADYARQEGQLRFLASSNSPSAASFFLRSSSSAISAPMPAGSSASITI